MCPRFGSKRRRNRLPFLLPSATGWKRANDDLGSAEIQDAKTICQRFFEVVPTSVNRNFDRSLSRYAMTCVPFSSERGRAGLINRSEN